MMALCVGLVAVVSCLGATLRTQAVVSGPAATLVDGAEGAGVAVQVEVLVVGDPLASRFGGTRVPARLRTLRPLADRVELETRERVLLLSDDISLPFGSVVVADGLLQAVPESSVAWTRSLGIVVQLRAADVRLVRPPSTVRGWSNSLRLDTAEAAHRTLGPARASLLTGLTTGDLTGQPPEIADQVDSAGLRHLVAVSGSNVALIVAATAAVVIALGGSRRLAWWCSLVAVWWLVMVVRADPSVIRASLMATLVLVALLIGRARSPLHVLAVGGTLALFGDPLLAGRLGFALSMAATAGVLLFAPRVADVLPQGLPRSVRLLVGATCGAQLAVTPVLLAIGSPLHPASVSANLVAVPAAAVGGLIGAVASVVATMSIPLASVVARAASPALSVVLWAARYFSSGPGRALSLWVVVAGGLVVVLRALWRARADHSLGWWRWSPMRQVAVLALGLFVAFARLPAGPLGSDGLPDSPVLVVLDVGQGDAILLGDPGAGWMMVDGGAQDADVVAALGRLGVERIERVVATHADSDHVGGLDDVLDALPVSVVTVGPRAEEAVDLLDTAARLDVPVEEVSAGFTWDHGQFSITVLSPPGTGLGRERNDNSLVMRIDGPTGSPSVLLPATSRSWRRINCSAPATLQSLIPSTSMSCSCPTTAGTRVCRRS